MEAAYVANVPQWLRDRVAAEYGYGERGGAEVAEVLEEVGAFLFETEFEQELLDELDDASHKWWTKVRGLFAKAFSLVTGRGEDGEASLERAGGLSDAHAAMREMMDAVLASDGEESVGVGEEGEEGDEKYSRRRSGTENAKNPREASPAIGRETNPMFAPEDSGVNISITDGNRKQILDSLDGLRGKNIPDPKQFLSALKRAFGFKSDKGSKYVHQIRDDERLTLRISDHRAKAIQFAERKEATGNTSVVVKLFDTRFRSASGIDLVQFVYYPDKFSKAKADDIVDGVKNWIDVGTFNGTLADSVESSGNGLVSRGEVNTENTEEQWKGESRHSRIRKKLSVDDAENLPKGYYHGGSGGATKHIVLFVYGKPTDSYWNGVDDDKGLFTLKEESIREITPKMISFAAEYYNVSEEEARELLSPGNIIDSAGAWDDVQFVSDLWFEFEGDFLANGGAFRTANGAVAFPYAKEIVELSSPKEGRYPEYNLESDGRRNSVVRDGGEVVPLDAKEAGKKLSELVDDGDEVDVGGVSYSVVRPGKAFHVSAAKFDKFDSSFMGTGEGQQSYGWGMYFLTKRGVWRFYRREFSKWSASSEEDRIKARKLLRSAEDAWQTFLERGVRTKFYLLYASNPKFFEDPDVSDFDSQLLDAIVGVVSFCSQDNESPLYDPDYDAAIQSAKSALKDVESLLSKHEKSRSSLTNEFNEFLDSLSRAVELKNEYEILESEIYAPPYTYRVEFDETAENMLDWTKELTDEQFGRFLAALQKRNLTIAFSLREHNIRLLSDIHGYASSSDWARDISLALDDAGFIGHKMPVGGTRTDYYSDGHNYVIYNADERVRITGRVRFSKVRGNGKNETHGTAETDYLEPSDFGEDGRVKPEVLAEIEAEKAKILEDAQKNGSFMKAPNGAPSKLDSEQWVLVRTKRFKRWFGDWEAAAKRKDEKDAGDIGDNGVSKVVDENGEPKVVYHGTGEKFYEFSHKFGMRNGASLGRGFYFTEDEDYARGYGNEIMGVFLNIRNPLEPGRNKISKEDLKRVIRRIDPNGDTVADYASSDRGYPGKEWYERSLEEAVNAIFSVSNNYVETSDSDILGELFSVWGGESALRGVADVLGYDGFIPKRTLSDDVKIAFFPEQIKSATENAGTYARENPDIRYSLGQQYFNFEGTEGLPLFDAMREQAKSAEDVAKLDKAERALKRRVDMKPWRAKSDAFKENVALIAHTFGFKKVSVGKSQYGSWTTPKEVYEALLDLAEILDVPPNALGFGGRDVEVDFSGRTTSRTGGSYIYGPRGRKIKAYMHGTLAHEWIHALHEWFGGLEKRKDGGYYETMRSSRGGVPVRAEMAEAFKALDAAIGGSSFAKRSKESKYYSDRAEMLARAFEVYVAKRLDETKQATKRSLEMSEEISAKKKQLNAQIEEEYRRSGGSYVPGGKSAELSNELNALYEKHAQMLKHLLTNFHEKDDTDGGYYPTIVELDAEGMTAAFDRLFSTLKWEEREVDGRKLTRLYSRRRAPRSSPVDEARMALATRDKIKDFEVVFDRDGVARFFDTRGKKPHEYELVFSVAGELEPAIFNAISKEFVNGTVTTAEALRSLISRLRNELGDDAGLGGVAPREGLKRIVGGDSFGLRRDGRTPEIGEYPSRGEISAGESSGLSGRASRVRRDSQRNFEDMIDERVRACAAKTLASGADRRGEVLLTNDARNMGAAERSYIKAKVMQICQIVRAAAKNRSFTPGEARGAVAMAAYNLAQSDLYSSAYEQIYCGAATEASVRDKMQEEEKARARGERPEQLALPAGYSKSAGEAARKLKLASGQAVAMEQSERQEERRAVSFRSHLSDMCEKYGKDGKAASEVEAMDGFIKDALEGALPDAMIAKLRGIRDRLAKGEYEAREGADESEQTALRNRLAAAGDVLTEATRALGIAKAMLERGMPSVKDAAAQNRADAADRESDAREGEVEDAFEDLDPATEARRVVAQLAADAWNKVLRALGVEGADAGFDAAKDDPSKVYHAFQSSLETRKIFTEPIRGRRFPAGRKDARERCSCPGRA